MWLVLLGSLIRRVLANESQLPGWETYLNTSTHQAPYEALEFLIFPPTNGSLEYREQPDHPLCVKFGKQAKWSTRPGRAVATFELG